MLNSSTIQANPLLSKVYPLHGADVPSTFPSENGFHPDSSSWQRTRPAPRFASWFGNVIVVGPHHDSLLVDRHGLRVSVERPSGLSDTACKFTQLDRCSVTVGVVATHHNPHNRRRVEVFPGRLGQDHLIDAERRFPLDKARQLFKQLILRLLRLGSNDNRLHIEPTKGDMIERCSDTGNGGIKSGYSFRCSCARVEKSSCSRRTSAGVRCTS